MVASHTFKTETRLCVWPEYGLVFYTRNQISVRPYQLHFQSTCETLRNKTIMSFTSGSYNDILLLSLTNIPVKFGTQWSTLPIYYFTSLHKTCVIKIVPISSISFMRTFLFVFREHLQFVMQTHRYHTNKCMSSFFFMDSPWDWN